MDEPLSIELDEEFFPTVDVWSGKAVPRDEDVDPDAPLIDENHVLDLTDVVRQSAQVGMEMHPLCRPDCKGLCSECGANLNDEPDHSHAVLDESPFAALRQLNLN
jgi:uncharacterized protein